jgi:hypothetical protein
VNFKKKNEEEEEDSIFVSVYLLNFDELDILQKRGVKEKGQRESEKLTIHY